MIGVHQRKDTIQVNPTSAVCIFMAFWRSKPTPKNGPTILFGCPHGPKNEAPNHPQHRHQARRSWATAIGARTAEAVVYPEHLQDYSAAILHRAQKTLAIVKKLILFHIFPGEACK